MSWVRLDDAFDTHPKVLRLGSDERRWTWLKILAYTCRYRSSVVPERIREAIPKATPAFIQECISAGLIDVDSAGTKVVHDWDKYQAGDPLKAARQARWRENRDDTVTVSDAPQGDGSKTPSVDGRVDGRVDAPRVGARAKPVPARPVPKDSSEPKGSSSSPDRQRFNEVWDAISDRCGKPTKALESLRAQIVNDLVAEGATAADVYERQPLLELRWPEMTITDTALRKHWGIALKPLPKGEKKGALALADDIRASSEGAMRILDARRNGHHTLTADFELPALEETYDG